LLEADMIDRMRRTVLLALGGLAGGGALAPLAAGAAPSGREIALLTTHLVADGQAGEAVRALRPGARVELMRAPGDAYDPRAVQVRDRSGVLLGRISPVDGKTLSSLLDAGFRTRARVASLLSHPVRPEVRIEIALDVG
jgi:hypothetical protein